jgi:hypothetical protein
MNMGRRWFTGERAEITRLRIMSRCDVRANGVIVGRTGPKRRMRERLAGFPVLATTIEDMFSARDKIVTRLVWRGTHTGSYGGIGAPASGLGSRTLPFGPSGWEVDEISTIPDRSAP